MGVLMPEDDNFMLEALRCAEKAYRFGEVPIGAVAVYEGKVIAKCYNMRETLGDPTAHAEMLAIRQASVFLGKWRLTGVTLYVTLEPCPMCAGAIINSRIDRLVYGARDPKAGAVGTLFDIVRDERLNHSVNVRSGVLEDKCTEILKDFFAALRERNKAKAKNQV